MHPRDATLKIERGELDLEVAERHERQELQIGPSHEALKSGRSCRMIQVPGQVAGIHKSWIGGNQRPVAYNYDPLRHPVRNDRPGWVRA